MGFAISIFAFMGLAIWVLLDIRKTLLERKNQ